MTGKENGSISRFGSRCSSISLLALGCVDSPAGHETQLVFSAEKYGYHPEGRYRLTRPWAEAVKGIPGGTREVT